MNVMKTSLPEMYAEGMLNEFNKVVNSTWVNMIFDTMFNGVTELLGHTKRKDKPVSYIFNRIDGSFVLGGTIQYFDSKDKKTPGSWNISWTFNEDDIPKDALQFKVNDPQTLTYYISYGAEKYGMKFGGDENLITIMRYLAICLRKWLDENAKEDSEITIEQDGVFKARVGVEDKEKVFAIEVMGETTAKAKEDSAIEK